MLSLEPPTIVHMKTMLGPRFIYYYLPSYGDSTRADRSVIGHYSQEHLRGDKRAPTHLLLLLREEKRVLLVAGDGEVTQRWECFVSVAAGRYQRPSCLVTGPAGGGAPQASRSMPSHDPDVSFLKQPRGGVSGSPSPFQVAPLRRC